jgi:beta-ureidopropionase / N-carbamoyl-L-amino-acid hydrolase
MIFVACRDGRSHTPEEWADRDAIAAGAATILEAINNLDRSLPRPIGSMPQSGAK